MDFDFNFHQDDKMIVLRKHLELSRNIQRPQKLIGKRNAPLFLNEQAFKEDQKEVANPEQNAKKLKKR